MTRRTRILTFGDLRDGDLLQDRNGRRWQVSKVVQDVTTVRFTIRDGTSTFPLEKRLGDEATILREWDVEDAPLVHGPRLGGHSEPAVQTVEKVLGGTVVAEVSDAEQAAADGATIDRPASVPSYESMTDLERRTHLYLLHGIWGDDKDSRANLSRWHEEAHEKQPKGEINAKYRPHVHLEPGSPV